MSETTIEMLVLEGFGNIVAAPNHEKIAVLLADRNRLITDVAILNNKLDEACKYKSKEDIQNLEMLEDEIDALKLVNNKLTNKIAELNENLDESNRVNEVLLEENQKLKFDFLKATEDEGFKVKKKPKSAQTSLESDHEVIDSSKLEINCLKEDNLNLKMEMEKLYDEIGSFEIENKILKEENKKIKNETQELKYVGQDNDMKLSEINKLKGEVEDLNNELDELMSFKINFEALKLKHNELLDFQDKYDNLKLENDKLNATLQLGNEKNSKSQATSSSSSLKGIKSGQNSESDKSNLELEWIRNENEKLLLEFEKLQGKLNEKSTQCSDLKEQLAEKDLQMEEFIGRYEKQQTSDNDLLKLQKKILDLEHLLDKEREEKMIDNETFEDRQKDLLKRNDQLWSQLSKMEQNYKDAMEIIRQQTERITQLEKIINEYEMNVNDLNEKLQQECQLRENFLMRNLELDAKLNETSNLLKNSEEHNVAITEANQIESKSNSDKILKLNQEIEELSQKLKDLENINSNLKLDIDSLNKEKLFIISQNDNTHQKVLHDYLALQEKYSGVNYQLTKMSKDNTQLVNSIKEREQLYGQLENDKTQMAFALKQEIKDKNDALDRIKQMELFITKVSSKFSIFSYRKNLKLERYLIFFLLN